MKDNNINLKKDSIFNLFIKIAIPSSIGTIFQNLYSVVDSIYAGQMISELALAAIGQVFPIYFIIIALGVGLNIGTTALIANNLGKNNIDESAKVFIQSIIVAIIISLIISITGILLSKKIIFSINDNLETLKYSLEYIKIIFIGSITIFILLSFNSCLSALGDTKSYRNVLIFSFFLNIILNPILISGKIFNIELFDALGISGIAIATIISQFIGIFYLIYKVKKTIIYKKIYINYLKPNYIIILNILKQGIPASIGLSMIALGSYIILYFVAIFGDNAIAGYSAAIRYEQLFLLPLLGLSTAVISIVGQNYGGNQYNRVIETYSKAITIGIIILTILGIILYLSSELAIKLFTDNEEVIKYGSIYLKISAFEFPVFPLFFIGNATFQGLKKPLIVMNMNVLRFVIIPLILLFLIFNLFDEKFIYIFITLLISRWLIAIFYYIYCKYKFNKILFNNH